MNTRASKRTPYPSWLKFTEQKDGPGTGMLSIPGGWEHAVMARARCKDGKIRTVRLNQAAWCAWCWAGRCTVGGKTVTGNVGVQDNPDRPFYGDLYFWQKGE